MFSSTKSISRFKKKYLYWNLLEFFKLLLLWDFVKSDDCIGEISLIYRVSQKIRIHLNRYLFARSSNFVNSNIYITKICWTKSNFPSKCDFKPVKDKNNHPFAPCEGIVKFLHSLLVYTLLQNCHV